jgi:hypothetical protein
MDVDDSIPWTGDVLGSKRRYGRLRSEALMLKVEKDLMMAWR